MCEETTSISGLSCTLDDIKSWMMHNRLKMNDKTEFMVSGGRRAVQKCNTNAIRVGETDVDSSPCVKLQGMT